MSNYHRRKSDMHSKNSAFSVMDSIFPRPSVTEILVYFIILVRDFGLHYCAMNFCYLNKKWEM